VVSFEQSYTFVTLTLTTISSVIGTHICILTC